MQKRKLVGLILCLAAIALPLADRLVPKPSPVNPDRPVVDVPPAVADVLKAGFAGSTMEAGDWSGLLYGMARTIESDKGHASEPC